MKGFEFRLARLARVRRVQEEVAKAAWQTAVAKAREADERLESIEMQLSSAGDYLRDAQAKPQLHPAQVLNVRRSIELLEDHKHAAQEISRRLHTEADEARAPWQAARAALEGLVRLEEKALTRFRQELTREEAKEADQIAIQRAARQRRRSA